MGTLCANKQSMRLVIKHYDFSSALEQRGAKESPVNHQVTRMRRFFWLCVWPLLLVSQPGWAVGTTAGATISYTAKVSYSIGASVGSPITSAPASFRVDELIQPVLIWQDASAVPVNSPGTNDVLTFLLTNSGNGSEAFSLSRTNGPLPLPAGNYTPLDGTAGSIYLENGLLAGFQATGPNADTAYVTGANDPMLAADTGQIIYVLSDTPAAASGSQGSVRLTAASLTAGAAGNLPGIGLAGLGQGGVFAVVGLSNAQAHATGSYVNSGLGLAITKSVVSIVDPDGTAVAMPGTVLTYQILASLSGTGTATNLVISDPLPAEVSYAVGSISVDGVAKTDAADADNAQFSANTVTVSLGDVAAPANIVITFRASIN